MPSTKGKSGGKAPCRAWRWKKSQLRRAQNVKKRGGDSIGEGERRTRDDRERTKRDPPRKKCFVWGEGSRDEKEKKKPKIRGATLAKKKNGTIGVSARKDMGRALRKSGKRGKKRRRKLGLTPKSVGNEHPDHQERKSGRVHGKRDPTISGCSRSQLEKDNGGSLAPPTRRRGKRRRGRKKKNRGPAELFEKKKKRGTANPKKQKKKKRGNERDPRGGGEGGTPQKQTICPTKGQVKRERSSVVLNGRF